MVLSAIDGKHFLPFVLNYPGYVFVKLFFPGLMYSSMTVLDGKNHLNVNLCVSSSHIDVF